MDYKKILDELHEIIYISDVETYELYFINANGRKAIKAEDYKGKKCYKLLQNLDEPCPFCTTSLLTDSDYYIWEYSNPITKRHYILKDKLIKVGNQLARMEIAVDITEKENTSQHNQRMLELERVLLECVKLLTSPHNLTESIQKVLETIGRYHNADRTYIFEVTQENTINNTYEWCAENIEPHINELQELPRSAIIRWEELFKLSKKVIIKNIDDIKDSSPVEYKYLQPQNINSLMTVPFIKDDQLIGFIGVDNPKVMIDETSLLDSLSYFVITETDKRKIENKLEYMSYHDALTGVYNRNKYINFIEKFNPKDILSVGVAFIDINELKDINDKYGHAKGDQAIDGVCKVIKSHFRLTDIYRIGGDEFVVISVNISKEHFNKNIMLVKQDIMALPETRVAIGYIWQDKHINLLALTEKADNLMYIDKQLYYKDLKNREQ